MCNDDDDDDDYDDDDDDGGDGGGGGGGGGCGGGGGGGSDLSALWITELEYPVQVYSNSLTLSSTPVLILN